jgi:hypothetical protein
MMATPRPLAAPAPLALSALAALDAEALGALAVEALGLRLDFALALDPLDPGVLASGERVRYASLGHPARRTEWLRGRAALKILLRRQGHTEDTSLLHFPHPRLSLTHSAGLALAVSSPDPSLQGLGIDFEAHRPVKPGTERFFLTEAERNRLGQSSEADLLRLWTVKEALFKADPDNGRDGGRHLFSYSLSGSLRAPHGEALGPDPVNRFRYFTLETPEGFLSVAVLTSPGAPA